MTPDPSCSSILDGVLRDGGGSSSFIFQPRGLKVVGGDVGRGSCGVIEGDTRGHGVMEAEGKCWWKKASRMGKSAVRVENQEWLWY